MFTYYYQEHLPHEDIAEIINLRHRIPCTALEVVRAVGKINDLLTVGRRWSLLAALRANRPPLHLSELEERGVELYRHDDPAPDEILAHNETLERLNEALDALDAEDRLLVALWFEHNRTAKQIADVLGYENHKYVYSRLRTILNQLRRKLGVS